MSRSEARIDPSIAASVMLEGVRRFLYPCASSMHEVVDPGGLERDARVLRGVQLGAQPFLGPQ